MDGPTPNLDSMRDGRLTGRILRVSSQHGFRIRRRADDGLDQVVAELLPNPDDALRGAEIVKDGSRTVAAVVTLAGRDFFLKKYLDRGFVDRVKRTTRFDRANRAWDLAERMWSLQIPVPRPLVYLDKRPGLLRRRTYVLMEFVGESESLRRVWERDDVDRSGLIDRIGSLMGRFHAHGCIHGDLKWANIVADRTATQVTFVDFDGGRILRRPSLARSRRDVGRFIRELDGRPGGADLKPKLIRAWELASGMML